MEKNITDAEKALEWWNGQSYGKTPELEREYKILLLLKHFPDKPKNLKLSNITGKEIVDIWRKETQQRTQIRVIKKNVNPSLSSHMKGLACDMLSNTKIK